MTVAEMLDGGLCYEVPGYQRPYSWGAEQAGLLIADLLERFRQSSEVTDEEIWPLFLGSVVISKTPGQRRLMVIDGQQRLITLSILLAVLRDLEAGADSSNLTAFIELPENGEPGHGIGFRVHPRPIDRAFLATYVQEPGATGRMPAGLDPISSHGFDDDTLPAADDEEDEGFEAGGSDRPGDESDLDFESDDGFDADAENGDTAQRHDHADGDQATSGVGPDLPDGELSDSQRRTIINRELMRARLQELDPAERRRLADFLARHCEMIVTTVLRPEYASSVFRAIHQSGIDLNDGDILKAEVLAQVTGSEAERLAERWDSIEALLGRKAFGRLFSHLRLIRLKRRQNTSIAQEIRQAYAPSADPAGFINDTLQPAAQRLFQIERTDYRPVEGQPADIEICSKINRLLMFLSWNSNKAWVPPVLHFLMQHGERPDQVLEFLDKFERLVASMTIRRVVEPQRGQRYVQVITAIDDGTVLKGRKSPMKLNETEQDETLTTITTHRFGRFKCSRMVLMRLDAHFSSPAGAEDYRNCTIEHILPKSSDDKSHWRVGFPKPDLIRSNINRLGNLCLLSPRDNHLANNHELAEKKQVYFAENNSSPFALKEQLRSARSWNPDIVTRREERLLTAIRGMWRLKARGKTRTPSNIPRG